MWILLYILIFFTSVTILPLAKEAFWLPKNAVFIVFGFILIASTWITDKNKIKTFKNKWIAYILIFNILGFAWFFFKPLIFANPDGKIVHNLFNYLPTLNLILGFLLIQVLVEYTDTLERWLSVGKFLCWMAFGFAVYGILQYMGLDQIYQNLNAKWVLHARFAHMITFFGNSMHTANYIAMISPLCLMFKGLRYKMIYLVMFIAICLSFSAISVVAFIIGLIIYLIMTREIKLLSIVTGLAIVAGLIALKLKPDFWSFGDKLYIWKMVFVDGIKQCYTGGGLGSFLTNRYMIGGKGGSLVNATCLEILQIFREGGFIMVFLVLAYVCSLFKRILFAKWSMLLIGFTAAFTSYLVITCGSFPLRIAPLALVGILYIACLEVQT